MRDLNAPHVSLNAPGARNSASVPYSYWLSPRAATTVGWARLISAPVALPPHSLGLGTDPGRQETSPAAASKGYAVARAGRFSIQNVTAETATTLNTRTC